VNRYASASLLLLVSAAIPPCQAAPRDEAYEAFQRCRAIGDERSWLDCIYGAVQPVRAQLHLPPAPDAQLRLVPVAQAPTMAAPAPAGVTHAPPKKESFVRYVLGGRKEVEAVPFRSYRFDGAGRFTVTLANDQVWRQLGQDHHMATWKADPARYVASIKTGALGSSVLQVRGESGGFMVEQVP
jgi:hypothetical protein